MSSRPTPGEARFTRVKQRFMARCAELGVEVEYTVHRHGTHYLMVHAPSGMIFENYGIDCCCLWEGEKGNPPNWRACLADMENQLPLVPDPNPEDDEEEVA
jgi:hypothetical protein